MKKCRICGIDKPKVDFYKGKSKDGLSCYCKLCNKEKGLKWYHKNKFKIAAKREINNIDCLDCRYFKQLFDENGKFCGFYYCREKRKVIDKSYKRCEFFVKSEVIK